MSLGNTKRRAGAASRLMASALVGIALLVLVGAGVYSKARGIDASVSELESQGFEKTSVNEAETASNIPTANIPTDGASSAPQKTKPAPQTPRQPSQPPQPDQPPQPSQAPEPSQGPEPSHAPQPSQGPEPSQPPQPSTAPKPPQGPPPGAVGIGVGHGAGMGVGRGVSGGVGSGRVTPATAPSAITAPATPRSPSTAPAAPSRPAKNHESSKSQSKEESSDQKSKDKVDKGELIEAPNPVYPVEARRQLIDGTVTVAIVIGEDGHVISAKAKSGPEPLYGASQEAAYKARFKPTTVSGKPAKASGVLSYNFVIDK